MDSISHQSPPPTGQRAASVLVAEKLCDEWKTDKFDKDAISDAVAKLAKLARTRNGWVHGDWCANLDKTETVIFNHRVHPQAAERKKPVKAADVLGHCAAVKQRAHNLGKLIKYEDIAA